MRYYIGLDVGGNHLTAALFKKTDGHLDEVTISDFKMDSRATASQIIDQFAKIIEKISNGVKAEDIRGIGISMPGPFDYKRGTSHITGLHKYESLFGMNLKLSLSSALTKISIHPKNISFINDAQAFLLGIAQTHNLYQKNITAVTIGTGFGSAGLWNAELIPGFPGKGYLYNDAFSEGTAEDYFSTRWFLDEARNGNYYQPQFEGVKELSELSRGNENIQNIFHRFGKNLASYYNQLFKEKKPDVLYIGGNIVKSRHLFGEEFTRNFVHDLPVEWIDQTSGYAAKGAVVHQLRNIKKHPASKEKRISVSPVLPVHKPVIQEGYDMYPTIPLVHGQVKEGFESFAVFLKEIKSSSIVIDGNTGVHWEDLIQSIQKACEKVGLSPAFFNIETALKSEDDLERLLESHLAGDDPIFGKIFEGDLIDFFEPRKIKKIQPARDKVSILYGTGAALSGWDAPVIYFDLPKNEIQYRSRAGSICNLGRSEADDPKKMYKRYYFTEWPVCNKHKQQLLPRLTAIADVQREETITWAPGEDVRQSLQQAVKHPFRVRPWFEPGVWGGKWMQKNIEGLNPEAENFAWSFELIAAENGVILETEGTMLEIGFEWLMFQDNRQILGDDSKTYGTYFPLRFDYLDTMAGGNLSLQCHPALSYIRDNFGEQITQDETYYIMKTKPGARVYLGFQDGVNPQEFEKGLMEAHEEGTLLDADNFVQSFPASKHDLYLIPAGTIHCSGKDNMVLEISNTPYIYTFKMYDWQRLDLDGKPRPINIERAMDNLDFTIQGERVQEEFISRPRVIESGPNGRVVHLPTHKNHLYSVHRVEVMDSMKVYTEGKFHLLNLVEGTSAVIRNNGHDETLHYAETMIIPAAAGKYNIVNRSEEPVKIVKAFMK